MARKILLADDSVTAQNMGRKILADAGYDVVTVNNGSAALKRIAELQPDLIVLDVYMPGYSGLEVCQRLKDAAETAHLPVLLTVGKLEPFKAEEARRVRADAHIVKPFEASELLTAIARLEDRIVPRSPESDPANAGWMSRLSFPSKKKKDREPEDVAVAEGAAFRDFRRGKEKTHAGDAFPVQAPTPEQDPDALPDIPRDITPEELDALSALAAKLDGPTPAPENTAPPAQPEVEAPVPVDPAPPTVEVAFAVEPAPLAVEGKNEFEIPVENFENIGPPVEDAAVVPVDTALLAQEPAPVDRNDEPIFASAASAVEQAAKEEAGVAAKPSEADEPAPSDAELVEALRLLTPATGNADVSTVSSHETSALSAESGARDAAAAPRWVADPVPLSPEEASISLEAEMFRTFAAMPATIPASSSSAEPESAPIANASAIAAAVEHRLANAGLADNSKALADRAESGSETTEVSQAASPAVHEVEAKTTEHKDYSVQVTEQVPAEEFSPTAQEAPKAMAAAAAAQGAATSASDAREIANIVDSVLADLRPKILEEITKKLAKRD